MKQQIIIQIVNNNKMIIFLIMLIRSKVFVIDDLNLTKRIAGDNDNKKLLKTITERVSKGNEEVVLYNEKSDLRMSSKDYGISGLTKEDCLDKINETNKKVEIDIPVIEQSNLASQIKIYENSVNELKNLVNNNTKSHSTKTALEKLREQRIQNLQKKINSSNFGNSLQEKINSSNFGNSLQEKINSSNFGNSLQEKINSSNFGNSLQEKINSSNFGNSLQEKINSSNFGNSLQEKINQSNFGNSLQEKVNSSNFGNSLQEKINQSNFGNSLQEKINSSSLQNNNSDYQHSLSKRTLDRLLSSSFDENLKKTISDSNVSGSDLNIQNDSSMKNINNNLLSGMLGYTDTNYQNKSKLIDSITNKEYGSNQNLLNSENSNMNLNNMSSNSLGLFNNSSGIIGDSYDDRLAYTKAKVEDNLYKAIDNRKEYINIKLQEIKINKDKLELEIRSYKEKVAELLVKIRRIRKTKDSIERKMNDNKNHIINLNKNSKQVINSKEQVFSLIRITRNEVLRYKNLLENETNKLSMLEKQYEVYEDTLKKYSEDIEQESNKLYRSSNELNKSTIDLENVESLYREYTEKNKLIEEDLRRYEKIADCLETEEKKVSRNQLNGLVL